MKHGFRYASIHYFFAIEFEVFCEEDCDLAVHVVEDAKLDLPGNEDDLSVHK